MIKFITSLIIVFSICGGDLSRASAQSMTEVNGRLVNLEEQLRQLRGDIEQLTHQIQQMKAHSDERKQIQNNVAATAPLRPVHRNNSEAVNLNGPGVPVPFAIKNDAAPGMPDQGAGISGVLDGTRPPESQIFVPDANGTIDFSANQRDNGKGGGQQAVNVASASPEALYEHSHEFFLRRQFGKAEAGFRDFLQKYPDHELTGSAQYWLGETFFVQGDFRKSAQEFLQGFKRYPKSRRAADSLLKLGLSLGRLGQKEQSCAAFAEIASQYPSAVDAKKRAQTEAKRSGC